MASVGDGGGDRPAAPAAGSGTDAGGPFRLESLRRRIISLPALVSLLVAGGFLVFLVTRFDVDLAETWAQVRGANPWLLAAAFAVHYTTFLFRGARWRILLQQAAEHEGGDGAPIPGVLYFSHLVLLGWFVNSIGWLRLGDAFRAYLYQEDYGAAFSGAIGTVLSERVLDAALVVILLLAVSPFLLGVGDDNVAWAVLGIAAALAGGLLAALATMLWARGLVSRLLPGRLAPFYQRFHDGAMSGRHKLLQTTLLGLMGWTAEAGRKYLVALALGFDLSPALIIFLTLASSLLTLVPTPGGLGAVESGVAGLAVRLSALGKESATALVLADRFITYISTIIVGAIVFAARPVFRRRRGGA